MPEAAMQAAESLSPRSLAATQGTDWVERLWLDPGLLTRGRDLNVQGPSSRDPNSSDLNGGDLNGGDFNGGDLNELNGRDLNGRDISGSDLPVAEFQSFQSLAFPGRGLFGIAESPEPGPCLDWGAASALTVPCYATSHLSLVTSSHGNVAVLVGSVPPPPSGAHRYRVEAPEEQLPLLLTQLKEVYDVSIGALSFQGVLHLAALLLPGEGWEEFNTPPPLHLPLGVPVTSHRASHKAGHRGPGASARPKAEGRRERGLVPGKGKSLPEMGKPRRNSEGPQKVAQSSRRPARGFSEEEVMGEFVRGWQCRPWNSLFWRRRHHARRALAPAPAANEPPRPHTTAAAAAAPAVAEASHVSATASAATQRSRTAQAPRSASAAARRTPTPAPAPAPAPAAPPLPPTRAPPPLTAAATAGAESPGQALLEGLAEGEAFCARVAQAADRVQYLLDDSGRARGPGSGGRIGASIVSLKSMRSCVRLEIDVQMGPALHRDWVLFPLRAPGAPAGDQAFAGWAPAGNEGLAPWAQAGDEATTPEWVQAGGQAPVLWAPAGDQAFAPQAPSGDQASAPWAQAGDQTTAPAGALAKNAPGAEAALQGGQLPASPTLEAEPGRSLSTDPPPRERKSTTDPGSNSNTQPASGNTEAPTGDGDPSSSSTEPPSVSTEPPSGNKDPSGVSTEPTSISPDPPSSNRDPPSVRKEPPSISTDPPSFNKYPPSGNEDPPSVSAGPPSISTGPPSGNKDPPSVSREPPSSNRDPPSVSREPPSSNRDPPSVSREPPSGNSAPPTVATWAPCTPQEPLHATGASKQGNTSGSFEANQRDSGSSGHTSGGLETKLRYTCSSLEISDLLDRCKRPLASPPLGQAPRTGLPPFSPPQAYPSQAYPPQVHHSQAYPSQAYACQVYHSQAYPSQACPPQVYPPQAYPPLMYLPLTSTLELCHELEGGQMLLLVRDQGSGAVQVLVGGCLVREVGPGCNAGAFHEPSRLLALYFKQSQLVELHQFAEDFSWVEFTGVGLPVTVREPWGGSVTVDGLEGAPGPWMGFAEIEAEGGCGRMQGFDSDTDETAYDETVLYGRQLHLVVLDRDGMAVLLYPVRDSFPGCQPPRALRLGPCQLNQGVVTPGGSHLLLLSAPLPSGMPAQRRAAQLVSKAEALRCMSECGALRQPLFLHVICLDGGEGAPPALLLRVGERLGHWHQQQPRRCTQRRYAAAQYWQAPPRPFCVLALSHEGVVNHGLVVEVEAQGQGERQTEESTVVKQEVSK